MNRSVWQSINHSQTPGSENIKRKSWDANVENWNIQYITNHRYHNAISSLGSNAVQRKNEIQTTPVDYGHSSHTKRHSCTIRIRYLLKGAEILKRSRNTVSAHHLSLSLLAEVAVWFCLIRTAVVFFSFICICLKVFFNLSIYSTETRSSWSWTNVLYRRKIKVGLG